MAEPAQLPHPGSPSAERFVSSYTALLREVQDAGLMAPRRAHYLWRIGALSCLFAAAGVGFAILGNSWFQLVVAGVLALVMSQLGFVAHDAAHRQIFASRKWNEWTARIVAAVGIGLSHSWWIAKHTRHHSGPNQIGKDPDIGPGAVAFTEEAAGAKRGLGRWLVGGQGWYFVPLLMLEGLHLHVASVRSLLGDRQATHRRTELALIAARLAGYVAVVVLVLPPGKAAAFLGVQLAMFGVLLGGAFAPNHIGMPIVARGAAMDFLSRQVLMSRNIRGGLAMDLAMGGLNRQIEHHLFPSMPRPNLRRAAPIVRRYCTDNGILYTQTSLPRAYLTIVSYLNRVGLSARRAVQCPLAAQLR